MEALGQSISRSGNEGVGQQEKSKTRKEQSSCGCVRVVLMSRYIGV